MNCLFDSFAYFWLSCSSFHTFSLPIHHKYFSKFSFILFLMWKILILADLSIFFPFMFKKAFLTLRSTFSSTFFGTYFGHWCEIRDSGDFSVLDTKRFLGFTTSAHTEERGPNRRKSDSRTYSWLMAEPGLKSRFDLFSFF